MPKQNFEEDFEDNLNESEEEIEEETDEEFDESDESQINLDNVEDSDEEESDEDESDEETPTEPEKKQKQSKEVNDFYKNKRLKAKEEKAIREDERRKVIIETLGGVNPFTNEPIEDDAEIQEYLNMKQIEKNGGDPVGDYAKYLREQKKMAAKQSKQAFSVENDLDNFVKEYPSVDVSKLLNEKDFVDNYKYALGKMPLSDIYKDYQEKKEKNRQNAKEKFIANRSNSSVGRQSGSTKSNVTKDINNLDPSSKEFKKLIERAKKGEFAE